MNNTLALRSALQSGAGAAETQLALIAENAGDEQLAIVMADFNAAEIAAMVGDADMTKPSLAHSFVTPEQFIGAFCRIGARWGEVQPSVNYSPLQQQMEDFICPMILASDDAVRRATMLAALIEHELGTETLLFMALDHKETPNILAYPHGFTFTRGTWQELFALTSEHHPVEFFEITGMAKEVYSGGESSIRKFAYDLLTALHDEARSLQAPEEMETEEFVDI